MRPLEVCPTSGGQFKSGAIQDDANLVKQDRAFYVTAFRQGVEKTVRATLEMYRVV